MATISVDQLGVRRPAVIAAVGQGQVEAGVVRRLQEMGFEEGVDLEVLHKAPLGGDPIAVRVGNTLVALRRAQAALVTVWDEQSADALLCAESAG